MAIRRFNVAITGISPLLLSNNKCSDPLSQASKDKKFFTGKRVKKDEDHLALRVIDWVNSGYWIEPGNVVIDETENTVDLEGYKGLTLPSQNFARCLRNAATAFKLGKEVNRAVVVENEPVLVFDGPDTAAEMIADSKFWLTSPVVRQKVTNWITRITLPAWSTEYQVTLDDERISADDFDRILRTAGRFEGLGTWRPRFGRFSSEVSELAA